MIRAYVHQHVIQPARAAGQEVVVIRAGDIHSRMGLQGRLPAVCGAIGTEMFEQLAQAVRLYISGPLNGADTQFTFRLVQKL